LDGLKARATIQAVHCIIQDALESQKENHAHLGNITRRLDAQAETTLLLLDNVKSD